MAELHVAITGDCSGAVDALHNTSAAIDEVNGKTAGVMAELRGADATISGLGKVAEARENAGGTVQLDVDHSPVGEARESLSGLRGDVRATARDLESISSFGGIKIGNDGSLRQMSVDRAECPGVCNPSARTHGCSSIRSMRVLRPLRAASVSWTRASVEWAAARRRDSARSRQAPLAPSSP